MNKYPELESRLWGILSLEKQETAAAKDGLTLHESLELLDIGVYFTLKTLPYPTSVEEISRQFLAGSILLKNPDNTYGISKLGALLFAKNLEDFNGVTRKY